VSLKVHGTNRYRSATYDFLLTFHSNHRPISYRCRDKLRFQSKIAKFSQLRVLAPLLKGFPLELGTGARSQKNWNDEATRLRKTFDDICSHLDTISQRNGVTSITQLRNCVMKILPNIILFEVCTGFLDPQNAPKSLAAGASPQTPLGELTVLPQTP